MSEPSKDAWQKADAALSDAADSSCMLRDSVAAALQELMDERDAVKRAIQDVAATLGSAEARAEAAEAKLAECVRRVREWAVHRTTLAKLFDILADYAPKTEEPPTLTERYAAMERAAEADRTCEACEVHGRQAGELDCPHDFDPEDPAR